MHASSQSKCFQEQFTRDLVGKADGGKCNVVRSKEILDHFEPLVDKKKTFYVHIYPLLSKKKKVCSQHLNLPGQNKDTS